MLYDFLNREDINWRKLRGSLAKEVYMRHDFGSFDERAFVFDDTIKQRRGGKVEGVSKHFAHTESRFVKGHQTLELGMSSPKGYLALDSQIFVGQKGVQGLQKEFKDARNAVAKDYITATRMTKHEMLRDMLSRALRAGFKAKYVIGDSWFGIKSKIKSVIDKGLVALFRMKKSKLKYCYQGTDYTAKELYLRIQRKMKKMKGDRWKSYWLNVQLNLNEEVKGEAEWVDVRILFVSDINVKKDQWAIFLSSDDSLEPEDILKIYTSRWGVEVYFKEIKRNMGFMKEQSGRYTFHYASIHLAAMRYLLFFHLMLSNGGASFGQVRDSITGKLEMLTFASLLWELFRALLDGAIDSFLHLLPRKLVGEIKQKIAQTITEFLKNALQLDSAYLNAESKAENLGLLG